MMISITFCANRVESLDFRLNHWCDRSEIMLEEKQGRDEETLFIHWLPCFKPHDLPNWSRFRNANNAPIDDKWCLPTSQPSNFHPTPLTPSKQGAETKGSKKDRASDTIPNIFLWDFWQLFFLFVDEKIHTWVRTDKALLLRGILEHVTWMIHFKNEFTL